MDAVSAIDPSIPPEELLAVYGEQLPGLALLLLYSLFLIGMAIAGLLLVIQHRNKLIWKEAEIPLPKKGLFKTVYVNAGMILFALVCLLLTTLSIL